MKKLKLKISLGIIYILTKSSNKAFKSDSQRLAVSLRSSIAKRCESLLMRRYAIHHASVSLK
ncbi:hypothetical protein CWO08_22860 [Vibrio sp. 10N.286.48.B8]|nr:hypothetical protein CWO08_22860 [Vibrio sp. 10N.286.48.B8]